MDAIRLGLTFRALRIRRGLRQLDVATRIGVSSSTISSLERGRIDRIPLATITRASAVLGADVDVRVRWRGAELDRLLDEGHARLVNVMANRLQARGWEVILEATFSIRGERGAIDVLALHQPTGTVLVVEIKTVVPDLQTTISAHDRKARLGFAVARERGWVPTTVSRLLVIEAGSTARDRVARFATAIDVAYPERGTAVRDWLRRPTGVMSGLLFVRSVPDAGIAHVAAGRQRVRRPRSARNSIARHASRELRG